jgi:hypothetical protein
MAHRLLLTAAAGVLAFTLTACSSTAASTDTGPQASNEVTDAPAPVVSDPDDVADDVARTFWASNTATDTRSTDAARRAVEWFPPKYAAIATTPLANGGGGADWIELTDHQGHMTVTIESGDDVVPDRPTDTTTTATRVRIVTLTPTGADGWIGANQHLIATLELTRADDTHPWLVNNISVDEALTDTPEGAEQDFD